MVVASSLLNDPTEDPVTAGEAGPAELESIRRTITDPCWRLEHLYWVVDDDGHPQKFTLRPAIRDLLTELHWRNIILKARQLGFTTFIALYFLDSCLFTNDLRAGIVAHKLEAAQVIYRDKILYAYDHLPSWIRERVTVIKRDGGELLLSNNSGIRVDTSMRSGTLQLVHVSEYGAMCAHYADKAREVKTGTLEAAHDEAIVFIESTAEGASGDFYEMCEAARQHPGPLSRLDYRFHFVPWYRNPAYVLDPQFVQFTGADDAYFAVVEREANVSLSAPQRAWYLKKRATLGPDMLREYPSLPREAFQATNFSIFDAAVLDALQTRCCPPLCTVQFTRDDTRGRPVLVRVDRHLSVWKIWEWPQVNRDYVVYGDVAEGILADPDQPQKGTDFHAGGILCRQTGEVVATYHSQQDTLEYAQQLLWAAIFYNCAWASPEVNSCGLTVLNEFRRVNYPRIYQRTTGQDEYAEQPTDKLGLKIGPLNRKPYIEALRTVLKAGQLTIKDAEIIAELRTFVNRDGKWQAARGHHDDFVMMLVGLVQLHRQCSLGWADIEQTCTADRPRQRLGGYVQAAVAGGYDDWEDDDDIDPQEEVEAFLA
jgi:hypothetical protein